MTHRLLMLATVAVCAAVTLVDPHYPTNAAGSDSVTSPDTAGDVGAFISSPTAVPGLVAHWSFDEGSGTVASDSSGNGNHGSIVGGPTWVQGHSGSALQFDGVDDYVEVPDSATLDVRQITIEAWVKPDVNDQLVNFVGKWKGGSPGQRSYVLNLGNSPPPTFYPRKAAFCISTDGEMDGEVHLVDTSDIPVGVWTHIAGTYDGSVMKIYVNGQLESWHPQTGDIFAGTAKLRIANVADNIDLFDGAVDEVKIYDRALTAQEIQEQFGGRAVGGIAELPNTQADAAGTKSSQSAPDTLAIAGLAAGGTLLLAAGGWYSRRRWRR